MKKENRGRLGRKIKYVLDDFISRGFAEQALLLGGTAVALTLLFGVVTMKLGEPDYREAYWTSLMHMIDQGTITADEAGTDNYFLFMLLVTFTGMAFTSTIIALISSALQGKLDEMKKGHSAIIEKNHVVILGFNENTYTICREIQEGSRISGERCCVAVADDYPKEEMEHSAREYRGETRPYFEKSVRAERSEKKEKIIYRSGDPASENTLSICAVQDAKAVIINRENDAETIRILLALVNYLKKNHAYTGDPEMPSVTALIHEQENLTAAKAAAGIVFGGDTGEKKRNEYKVRILYDREVLGSLFAQACVHQGIPFVLDGLFNYRGSSIRLEKEGEAGGGEQSLAGKSLPEIAALFPEVIPLGFVRKTGEASGILLAPSERECFREGDRLICLSEKPGLRQEKQEETEAVGSPAACWKENGNRNFLLIGRSEMLPVMLKYAGRTCAEGSSVTLISPQAGEAEIRCRRETGKPLFGNGPETGAAALRVGPETGMVVPGSSPELKESALCVRTACCEEPYRWENVRRILEENSFWFNAEDRRHLTNIVILSQDGIDRVRADEQVMILLLNLRQYLKEKKITGISITSEMLRPQDQSLLQNNSDNDFVLASEIINRMLAQIAGDPRKYYIIEELLKQKSSGIELYSVNGYADTAGSFNFEFIFREAVRRGKENGETVIPLGWIRTGSDGEGPEGGESTEGQQERPCLVLNPSEEERERIYPAGSYSGYRLILLKGGSDKVYRSH